MPRGKKKRWIRMKRNVNTVLNKRLATNVLHLTDAMPLVVNNTEGFQGFYGGLTLLDSAVRARVQEAVNRVAPGPGAGITGPAGDRRKHVVVGMMNNLTIKNVSETGVAYIDLYYWRAKKNCAMAEYSNIEDLWINGFTANAYNNPSATGTSSTVSATDYGITPWASPGWREFVQVYMKRRIRLAAGSDTELSLRTGKDYYSPGEYLYNELSLIKGKTEGIFVVFTGDPYVVTPPNTTTRSRQQRLVMSRVRTLYFKLLEGSLNTAGETTI